MLVMQERGGVCVDCGNDNPLLLDFDHTDPTAKLRRVSELTRLHSMREEAAKCELRCANCHRLKTWLKDDYRAGKLRLARG